MSNEQGSTEKSLNTEALEIYSNGFEIAHTNSDVVIILKRNQVVVANLNISFTLAKTLAGMLGGLVSSIEEAAGITINTTKEFDKAFENAISSEESKK
tara:strand:- start:1909 stop:2202 length:294 start_codon:yes stop_codon:yes gene_type:complete